MKTFFLLLLFIFPLWLIVSFMISHSRRKLRRSRHGLTGMCHKDGGAMCCNCSAEKTPDDPGDTRPQGPTDRPEDIC